MDVYSRKNALVYFQIFKNSVHFYTFKYSKIQFIFQKCYSTLNMNTTGLLEGNADNVEGPVKTAKINLITHL